MFIAVYRKTTDFCKLILYPAILLKLFMVSRSFGVEFFWSLRYKIMSCVNSFTTFYSFYFFLPYCSDWNSRTMLNKSGESGHPCLIPDSKGNGFSFSPLSMMLAIGLSYLASVIQLQFHGSIVVCPSRTHTEIQSQGLQLPMLLRWEVLSVFGFHNLFVIRNHS
jgi:hypothetical protein